MPELPEVETTVQSLNRTVKGLRIIDVWSNYNSLFHKGKKNIKDKAYFELFKKAVINKKILNAKRIAKNVLINLSDNITILVHMKMTGHFLFGKYENKKNEIWEAVQNSPLKDPANRFIRTIFTLSNKKHLAFSDMRRFAKICFFKTDEIKTFEDLKNIGPEPLSKNFSFLDFKNRLMKKQNGKIKLVLMDQNIIAGIGNIYSDEILWQANIHPLSKPSKIPIKNLNLAFLSMKKTLKRAIKYGGDSMSDFRKIDGSKGKFQNFHKVYRKTNTKCQKIKCRGKIIKIKMGGRSAHFCSIHQKLFT